MELLYYSCILDCGFCRWRGKNCFAVLFICLSLFFPLIFWFLYRRIQRLEYAMESFCLFTSLAIYKTNFYITSFNWHLIIFTLGSLFLIMQKVLVPIFSRIVKNCPIHSATPWNFSRLTWLNSCVTLRMCRKPWPVLPFMSQAITKHKPKQLNERKINYNFWPSEMRSKTPSPLPPPPFGDTALHAIEEGKAASKRPH